MSQKVLFLDFDGPLFPDRIIRFHPDNSRPYPGALTVDKTMPGILSYWRMDPVAIGMLNSLQKIYPFTTVISSSWKRFSSKEFIEELFQINDLNLPLHEDWHTDRTSFKSRRLQEIMEWMESHPGYECLILEDPWSGPCVNAFEQQYNSYPQDYKEVVNKEHIVIIDPMHGMDEHDYTKMRLVVERWGGMTIEEQQARQRKRDILLQCGIF